SARNIECAAWMRPTRRDIARPVSKELTLRDGIGGRLPVRPRFADHRRCGMTRARRVPPRRTLAANDRTASPTGGACMDKVTKLSGTLALGTAALAATPSHAPALTISEVESNNTFATAQTVPMTVGDSIEAG